jgi:hypothetical protein
MVPGGELDLVGEYYVGVKNGAPIVRDVSDPEGDQKSIELFPDPADALSRYHNVRRVRLYLCEEPVRAPEDLGAIDGN